MICIDASILLRLFLQESEESPIAAQWRSWHEQNQTLVAPTLLFYEVANALRRYVVHKELLAEEAAEILDAAMACDIRLFGDDIIHRQALSMAERFALNSTYDAHYLVVAEQVGAEFWTADRRLQRAVGAELPWVNCL
jgi:predicted nucleic acid-binding protein